jgi:hypothetical protein
MTDWSRMQNLDPSKLARMLAVEGLPSWTGDDAAAILRHQLAAPLLPDLLLAPGAEESRLRSLVTDRPGAASFLEQLTALHPSLELLQAIKAFARRVHDDPANPLHGSPSDVLYYASIASALLRCHQRITTLPDADLRAGLSWTLGQAGAEPLRHILSGALQKLDSR